MLANSMDLDIKMSDYWKALSQHKGIFINIDIYKEANYKNYS